MKTCLVVDDSRIVRKVAGDMLKQLGFGVVEAEDGQKALDACAAALPDFVLLDWNMPVMDGMAFMKEFRAKYGPDRIIIFCTTMTDMANIVTAMGAGANEYVMKPFDKDILQGKLAQVGLL
jgi:two-component system chemotaxis response regulator CheY